MCIRDRGSCVSTDTIFVEENVISDAGTITGTQTICSGDTPLELTSTSTGTASGTMSYRWERQAVTQNPASDPWTSVGSNSLNLSFTGTISESTRLRRVPISALNGNSCEGVPTSVVVVTIGTPAVINFTNLTTTTICTGDTVQFEATAGGVGPFDYSIYYNGGLTAVYSVTNTSTTPITFDSVSDSSLTLSTGDYFYWVVEDNNSCQSTSASITVTVTNPPAVLPNTTISFPGDTFCEGENVDFEATPIVGASYEYQIDAGALIAVGSSSFTIPYAQLAGSATVTVYVTSGSCVSTAASYTHLTLPTNREA